MKTINRVIACGCMIVLLLCLAGCSSSTHSSVVSASSQAEAVQESQVEDKFLGHWTGYDMYKQGDEGNPVLFSDMGASGTLGVDADGSLTSRTTFNGSTDTMHLRIEKGASGHGYTVYDESGQVFGALEYDKNGPVNWLTLFMPDDHGVLFGFTYYKKD